MEEELKFRFIDKTIEDILNGNHNPIPTIICEREQPYIMELVRKFCLFTEKMVPFKPLHFQPIMTEGLETYKDETEYGELYILVNIN